MASDPYFLHHSFKEEPTEIQRSVSPDLTNIKTEPKQSYLAELLTRQQKECLKCKINVFEEYFEEHSLVCSMIEKENQFDGDDNYSQISTFQESQEEAMEATECTDSESSNLAQQSLIVSGEIEDNANAVNNYYYANRKDLHENSEGGSGNEDPLASEADKSYENSVNGFLLQDATYSCSMCSFTTSIEQSLSSHKRLHEKSIMPILKCIYCNQKYIQNALYLHVLKLHPGHKLQGIDAAGLTVNLEETFKTRKLALQCPKCKYNARSKIALQGHLERHRFKETGTFIKKANGFWQCDKCSHSTKGICDLQKHRTCHERLPMQSCPWCDFKSISSIINSHKVKCKGKTKNVPVEVESNPSSTNNIKCNEKTKNVPVEVESNPPVTNNIKCNEKTKNVPVTVESNPPLTNKQNLFKCANCPFSAESHIILKSHMQYKHGLLKCPYCSISIKNSFNFRKHLKLHKIYLQNIKCQSCDFEGPLPTVKNHCAQNNHKYSKYNTTIRKKKSDLENENSSLKEDKEPKSIVEHVTLQQNQTYAYECYKCSFSTIKRRFLKVHSKTHIQKQPINQCSECDYQSTPQALKIHILACHQTEELDIEHKVGQCFVCSASFTINVDYQKHWKMHVEGFPIIKCGYCDFKSTSSVTITHQRHCKGNSEASETDEEKAMDLEKNEENVSEEKVSDENVSEKESASNEQRTRLEFLIQCNLCDAKISKNKIKPHFQSHSRFPIKKCSQCNFKSTCKYLQTHIRNTGHYSRRRCSFKDRLVPCNLCDAKILSWHFKRHLESHSILKLQKCHQCSFTSIDKYLKIHIRDTGHYRNKIHKTLDKKGIKCKFCSLICYETATLEKHMASHLLDENKKGGKEKSIKENLAASDNSSNDKTETTENDFQCSLCSFSTNLRFKLNMHKKKKHPDSIDEKKKILNCTICSWTTQNNQLLEQHLNTHYTLNKPVMQCAYCSFKGSPTQIKYHEQCTVPKPENRTKPNVKILLKCTQSKSCTFTTYLPAELKNHNHLKAIKCDFCSFSSFFQYRVDLHLLSHTKFKMPVENCPDCDFHSTSAVLSAHKNKCPKRQMIEESLDSSSKKRRTTK